MTARGWPQQGIVVVSINYRVGVLGYLAHPRAQRRVAAGRVGQLRAARSDRGAAVGPAQHRRVRRRCRRTSPSRASPRAALSVMYLMASPHARGLFAKAIAQSAYMISTPELKQRQFGDDAGGSSRASALRGQLGAPIIAALRAMDARAGHRAPREPALRRSGRDRRQVLPRQLVEVVRPRRAGAGAAARRLQQRRDPFADRSRAAAAGKCRGL